MGAPCAALALLLLLGASGCGGGSPSRDGVLRSLKQETVVPGFERVSDAAAELEGAIAEGCRTRPTSLPDGIATALFAAHSAWSGTQAFWAGPVMDRRSWSWMDDPVDPERVDALLTSDEPAALDADYVRSKIGSNQRGFGAADVLLAPATTGTSTRRCAYLRAVSKVASDEADAILAAWSAGEAGAIPEGFTVDEVVVDVVFLLQMIERELTAAVADESVPGQQAHDLRARLGSLRAVLVGSGESPTGGLAPLLDDELAADLHRQLEAAETAGAGLERFLAGPVDEDQAAVQTALERLTLERVKALKRTVATQVVSHLGVTVGFSDADGDSG